MRLVEFTKPKYVYHATFTKHIPGILKKGLMQFQPSNWVRGQGGERYNEDAGIFAFEHPQDAFRWAFKMQFEHNQPTSIVRIKAGGPWQADSSEDPALVFGKGKALVSRQNIKASSIVDAFDLKDFGTPVSLNISQDEWFEQIVRKLQA